ncbi:MAG: glycosyltransferase family 9 protein [Lacipirellulaceae bacterium]
MSSSSPRILIVRLTAVGDVIHGMPVACALRDAFPNATLGWVVEGGGGDLLEGHPAIDHLIRVPRRWWKSLRTIRTAGKQLRALEFDTTVDLQCLTKSAVLAKFSGARRRLGAGGKSAREISGWLNNELTVVKADHVVDLYLGILKPLGITQPEVRFDMPEREVDGQFADSVLQELSLPAKQYVVLNPGAGWNSKLWPAERYGEIAKRLFERFGVRSLAVWGGQEELAMAETIVRTSDRAAMLAPSTSLRELSALLRRARLFIGSDTGPMHLAVAVDTPAVSLHGTSRAEWCGAYGASNRRVQAYYQEGSAKERRSAENTAMRAITVEDVFVAASELLEADELRRCG